MPADGRQRGGDDGLVERAEEHRQHDAEDDGADLGMRQPRRLRLGGGGGVRLGGVAGGARVHRR